MTVASGSISPVTDLEVVLKIAERCNINCSYCYVFNRGDESYRDHPALMSRDHVVAVANFIGAAARRHGLERVKIDFHGGEPMLIGWRRYIEACETIRDAVRSSCDVRFVIQTNATLVTSKWIEAFAQTGTAVGVSLDGPKDINDRERIDHKGHGTYDRTVAGLRLLQQASSEFPSLTPPAAICVVDPTSDAEAVFNHFRKDLGISSVHYLLPDVSHLSVERPNDVCVTKYLRDLLRAWISFRASVRIRLLDFIFGCLEQGAHGANEVERSKRESAVVTIGSNGALGPNDSWRTVCPTAFSTGMTVTNSTLADFLSDSRVWPLVESARQVARECHDCCWQRICQSGSLFEPVHRFAGTAMFDKPSVYCSSIQAFLTDAVEEAIKSGTSFSRIERTLVSRHEDSI